MTPAARIDSAQRSSAAGRSRTATRGQVLLVALGGVTLLSGLNAALVTFLATAVTLVVRR